MEKYIKHFKVIVKHKWYVGIECFKRGLYWQGIIHDLSKFSKIEFFTSARYFQGSSSPIDAEKRDRGYSIAWLNHKSRNKHHWQYWTDFEDGKVITIPMPRKYLLEMVCDFIGAGKAYNNTKWNPRNPLDYYNKVKGSWFIHPETEKEFVKELESLIK